MFKLEIGKRYRSRKYGIVFEITSANKFAEESRTVDFYGKVVVSEKAAWPTGTVSSWKENGCWCAGHESELDLVEEVS